MYFLVCVCRANRRVSSLATRGTGFGDGSTYIMYCNVRALRFYWSRLQTYPSAASDSERHRRAGRVELPYLGCRGTLALSISTSAHLPQTRHGANPGRSPDGLFPLRIDDGTLVRGAAWLELRLQLHEQRHVRRAVRALAGAVPDARPRDEQRPRRGRHRSASWRPSWRSTRTRTSVPICIVGVLSLVAGVVALGLPFEPRDKAAL